MATSIIKSFLKEEDGQDLVEYSLLLAFIALAATAALTSIQGSLKTIWGNVKSELSTAANKS